MKKNSGLILTLLILVIVTGYFLFLRNDSMPDKELRDFAVKDTASVTKIFLADRNGNTITLDKNENGKWKLNGKDDVKTDYLKLLFDAFYKIEVRSPVSKAAYNNVIKTLASSAIKCEIYLNYKDTPFKTYYVGGQTEDALGTFMMIEKSSMPFITQVPGFNGYLTPRYSVKVDSWKSTLLFNYAQQEIKTLMVNYTGFPEKSYVISQANGRYTVQNIATSQFINSVDPATVENYLMLFQSVYYESWLNELKKNERDSIMMNGPSVRISIRDSESHLKELEIYPKPITSTSLAQVDSLGHDLKYDLDRAYGLIKPTNDLVTIQRQVLDKLLRQFSDFDANRTVNKVHRP